jgi:hypothetical protein
MTPRTRTLSLSLVLVAGCGTSDTPIQETDASDSSSSGDAGVPSLPTTADSSSDAGPASSSGAPSTTAEASSSGTPEPGTSDSGTSDSGSDSGTSGASPSTGTESGTESSGGVGPTTSDSDPTTPTTGLETDSAGFIVFIDPLDLPGPACSTYDDQCPEGEKCSPFSAGGLIWDTLGCFPLDPAPDAVGEPCTAELGLSGVDSCAQGAMCWNVNEAGEGTCIAFCGGSPEFPMCAEDTSCTIVNDGVLNVCLPGCDPLAQDCEAGQACIAVADEFTCVPDASGAEGQQGDECMFLNGCDPGLLCVDGTAVPGCPGFCCTSLCDATDPASSAACDDLAAGTECVPFFAVPPPGSADVGVCLTPL